MPDTVDILTASGVRHRWLLAESRLLLPIGLGFCLFSACLPAGRVRFKRSLSFVAYTEEAAIEARPVAGRSFSRQRPFTEGQGE